MPILSLDRVSKTYVRGSHAVRALREVSLDVEVGTVVGVYGRPGSGKSTLLLTAVGLEEPDSGTVRFDGVDLHGISRHELTRLYRDSLAWVDREGPRGDALPVLDYVALAKAGRRGLRLRDARRLAAEVLSNVGAGDIGTARWSDLSDGERMQVALAHGIVREPRLLVLDDPTSGLDTIDRERFMAQLRSLASASGTAVLLAVPDAAPILRVDTVRTLSRGRLIAPPDPPDRGTLIPFPERGRTA